MAHRCMRTSTRLVAIGCLAAAPWAHADLVFETAANLGVSIADDAYNGTVASMACANISVSGTGASTVSGLAVTTWIDHTWVGDLVIKVLSPDNTVVTLMSRPGVAEAADDGTAVGGDNSNLSSIFPIQFNATAAKSAELMGNTLGDAQVVCRDDLACDYLPNRGAAAAGTLATFNGKVLVGTWRLCVGDGGQGDTGLLQKVRLIFPGLAPGTLQVSPATLDFGSVVQGNTSVTRFITLANTGNQDLSVNTITTALPPFVRTIDGTCGNSLPRVIASGTQCTLGYAFMPSAQDAASQPFSVQTDTGLGDFSFTLTGSGDAIFIDGFGP